MALIKLGALAQDVRGSLNGTTFSRNKGGAYVRSKVSPVQPVSAFSANSRQAFKAASQAWASSLTDVERGAWIAFAAIHPFINIFGDSINLSGIAFFQAANKRLQQLGYPMYADAPTTWDVVPPGAIAPVISVDGVGNINMTINPATPPSAGTTIAYLFATPKIPNGALPQKNQYRLVNTFDAAAPDDTFDWGPDYATRFFPYVPAANDRIGILYAYFDTLTGALSVASGIVVAASAIPGPLIPVDGYIFEDQGGGIAQQTIFTAMPHGITALNTVDAVSSDPLIDFSGYAVASVTPTSLTFTPFTHAAVPFTAAPAGSTVQAVS
jgi:hypothetical protein